MDANFTGQKIAGLRKEKSITQKELAERLHVSAAAVSKWERGLNFPDLTILEPLAATLGISAAELLGIENEPAETVISSMTEISKEERALKKAEKRKRLRFFIVTAFTAMAAFALFLFLGRDTPENNALLQKFWIENITFWPLLIGLVSWGFGIAAIFTDRRQNDRYKNYCAISLLCCAVAIYFAVFMIDAQLRFDEFSFSTLDDTVWGWHFSAAILLLGTIFFNGCAWLMRKNRQA